MPKSVNLSDDYRDESYGRPMGRTMSNNSVGSGIPVNSHVAARRKKNQTSAIIILSVEVIVFIAFLLVFIILNKKISDSGSDKSASNTNTEASAEGGEQGTAKGVNVESSDFTLTCSRVQLVNDVNGSPVAVIYFNFVNKTDTPLSMSDVFPPRLEQNGMNCASDAVLTEEPPEYANRLMQVSGGQSVECCFVFSITDLTSPLTLTIHDNYSTFTDIGYTEILLS